MARKTNLRLRATRVLRGFRQEDLARKIGRSQSWLCQLERGRIKPTDIDVALICRALNVHPEAILADDHSKSARLNMNEPEESIEVIDAY